MTNANKTVPDTDIAVFYVDHDDGRMIAICDTDADQTIYVTDVELAAIVAAAHNEDHRSVSGDIGGSSAAERHATDMAAIRRNKALIRRRVEGT